MVRTRISKLRQDHRGVAMIEFALVFPFLFLLIFGGIEVTRLILIQQKLEKAGYVIASIVAQYTPATKTKASGEISEAEIRKNVFPQYDRMMSPYQAAANEVIILTSVSMESGNLKIKWQVSGGGTLTGVTSVVNGTAPGSTNPAVAGTTPTFTGIPASSFSGMQEGENFIVSEVFYKYQPILQQLLQGVGAASSNGGFTFYLPEKIYTKQTFAMPRNGEPGKIPSLPYLPDSFPVP